MRPLVSDQSVSLPQAIISKIKEVRHNQLILYSGQIESVKDGLELVALENSVEESKTFFAKRIAHALKLATDQVLTSFEPEITKTLVEYIQLLKNTETIFGHYHEEDLSGSAPVSVEIKLTQSKYTLSDSLLASFQNRGDELNELRNIILRAEEKVIVLTGMPGIGKTALLKAFFLKLLADWNPIWVNVIPGSSVARLVSEIGSKFGIIMDVDSLSTATEKVFRRKISRIFDTLFSLQRFALVIDDLIDLRGNSRDYHHLQAIIEEATKYEKFKGSRIFLISSVSSPPLFIRRAGVARIHIRGLEEKHIRRTIEYQLRVSTALDGETIPDIPQKIYDFVSGHPLVAKVVAEASRKSGIKDLQVDLDSNTITAAMASMLPKISLSPDELKTLYFLSVFRIPVYKELISQFCDIKIIDTLTMKAVVDFDGLSLVVHPIIRSFYLGQISQGALPPLHKLAVSYYDSVPRKERLFLDDNVILLETIHHCALAGDLNRLSEIRANSYEELLTSARKLYTYHEYNRALSIFISIAQLRPNDPVVWACIGRCYGRKLQWSDCDQAFEKAIKCAKKLNGDTWWIYRDWGHIGIRYKHIEEGKKHLQEAKAAGGKNDPSVLASEAYMTWQEGKVPDGRDLFEKVLKIDPNHQYTLSTYPKLLESIGDTESLSRAQELRKQYDSIKDQMIPPRAYDFDSFEDEDI